MVMFVHLAPASQASRIRRNGIACPRSGDSDTPDGIFAVPVTGDFFQTHQWLRELRRFKQEAMIGVYFRLPDTELVRFGRYNLPHQRMTAAEAAAAFYSGEDRQGWEVIITRRIRPKEIHRIRALPQLTGWRYFPGAKGQHPYCVDKCCTRGEYGARHLRKRFAGSSEA